MSIYEKLPVDMVVKIIEILDDTHVLNTISEGVVGKYKCGYGGCEKGQLLQIVNHKRSCCFEGEGDRCYNIVRVNISDKFRYRRSGKFRYTDGGVMKKDISKCEYPDDKCIINYVGKCHRYHYLIDKTEGCERDKFTERVCRAVHDRIEFLDSEDLMKFMRGY